MEQSLFLMVASVCGAACPGHNWGLILILRSTMRIPTGCPRISPEKWRNSPLRNGPLPSGAHPPAFPDPPSGLFQQDSQVCYVIPATIFRL